MDIRKRTDSIRQDAPIVVSTLVAAALRIARLVEAKASDPLYAAHLLDARFYDEMAKQVLATGPNVPGPFIMAPLYGYFLAGVYRVFGTDPTPVYVLQVALGSITAGLAASLGQRLGGPVASWTAGLAVAIYAQLVLYDVRLLSVSLSVFLVTLGAVTLVRAWDSSAEAGRSAWPLVAGLVLGLDTTARANMLLALPFVGLAFLLRGRRGVSAMVLFALGAAAPLALTTAHNWAQGERGVPVSVNGGINLYRGNNPLFVDEAAHPFRLDAGKDALARKARLIASIESGRWVTYREADRYWIARTIAEWRADPLRYALLFGRKLSQTLGFHEVGDTNDLEHEQERSRVLSLLPRLYGPAAILAVLGLATGLGPRRRELLDDLPLRLVLAIGFVSIALFFFVSRYRVPLFPLTAAYAGATIAGLIAHWRQPRVVVPAVVAIALLLVLLVPSPTAAWLPWAIADARTNAREQPCALDEHELRDPAIEEEFKVAAVAMARGNDAEAEERMRAVWAKDPGHTPAGVNLSYLLLKRGADREAGDIAATIVRADRCDDKALANLGLALLHLDQPVAAARALEQAIRIEKYEPSYWLNLGAAYVLLGRESDAKVLLDRSIQWGDDQEWQGRYLLGRIYVKSGDYKTAQRLFAEAGERTTPRADLLAWSGLAAFGAGDIALARQRFAAAEPLGPDDPAVKGLAHALLMAPPE
jgi:tetratricopeptide (TPR) repeat protein/4-amino-4-deoxy-L-arabinose transferase-like glycosyltransferase